MGVLLAALLAFLLVPTLLFGAKKIGGTKSEAVLLMESESIYKDYRTRGEYMYDFSARGGGYVYVSPEGQASMSSEEAYSEWL